MCLTIGREYKISPLEIYEKWEHLKVILTYVDLHNRNITEYIIQDQATKGVKQRAFNAESEYIRNETAEYIESLAQGNQEEELTEAQKELNRIYGE